MDYRKLVSLLVLADMSFQRQRARPGQETEDYDRQQSGTVEKRRKKKKAARAAKKKSRRKRKKGKR